MKFLGVSLVRNSTAVTLSEQLERERLLNESCLKRISELEDRFGIECGSYNYIAEGFSIEVTNSVDVQKSKRVVRLSINYATCDGKLSPAFLNLVQDFENPELDSRDSWVKYANSL
jgi:hypothetical protein